MKILDVKNMTRAEIEECLMETSSQLNEYKAKIEAQEQEIKLYRKALFGAKSEKSKKAEDNIDENQISMFNDTELFANPDAEEPKIEKAKVPAATRKPKKAKKKGAKNEKLKSLPVKRTEYILSEEERVCPECNSLMTEMKKVVTREVEVIPAELVVREHISHQYVCRQCEKNNVKTPIVQSEAPKSLLPSGFPAPSLMSFVVEGKFHQRSSIEMISETLKCNGLNVSKQTVSNWIQRGAEKYAALLYNRMWYHLLKSGYINVDETTVQVLEEEGRSASSKSYMWVYCSNHTNKPMALFSYSPSRAGYVPEKALEEYKGIIQCDGYDAYNAVKNVVRVGCFAHVRRKFIEALDVLKSDSPPEMRVREQKAVDFCNRLFMLDAKVKKLPLDQRLAWKEENIRGEMDKFFKWLEEQALNPESQTSRFKKAIKYALNEKKYLYNYFADGRIEISNNRAESHIRPFVCGRNSWLFCRTPRGANSSAAWYSLVISAKRRGLNVFKYLEYALDQMRRVDYSQITDELLDKLLPTSDELPKECFVQIYNQESED